MTCKHCNCEFTPSIANAGIWEATCDTCIVNRTTRFWGKLRQSMNMTYEQELDHDADHYYDDLALASAVSKAKRTGELPRPSEYLTPNPQDH